MLKWILFFFCFLFLLLFPACSQNADDDDDTSSPPQECTDADSDTYCSESGTEVFDCDDNNADIHPNADEVCDGVDNNCDGTTDEGVSSTFYADTDKDSYGDPDSSTEACSVPQGYVANNQDCDDTSATVSPTADEQCNWVDDDCDGETDEGELLTLHADADGDSFGDPDSTEETCPGSGWVQDDSDCNDADGEVNPNALEVCNGIDDDCDDEVDEGLLMTFFHDSDGDWYGNPNESIEACTAPPSYFSSTAIPDCDDSNAAINPSAEELCNGIDDDCDEVIDEGLSLTTFYQDSDGDGFGVPNVTESACNKPDGFATNADDCDDTRSDIFPGANDVPYDGVDNDCRGGDETDVDDDGFDSDQVQGGDDCDDTNATVFPGATEIGDGRDNDCDGETDEDLDTFDDDGDCSCEASTCTGSASETCATLSGGDCDDGAADIHPAATETCNGKDDNCDGTIDEGVKTTYYRDKDGDGHGIAENQLEACEAPTGYVEDATDCNDDNATIFPGASEACNEVDDDCDGQVDEEVTVRMFFQDSDGDGFGDSESAQEDCAKPAGTVEAGGDCDDADPSSYPGADEQCDGKDHDCDGVTLGGANLGEANWKTFCWTGQSQ